MKLFSLFVILMVSFIHCTYNDTKSITNQPIFERESSIFTSKPKSMYSALLMSLYSLPKVQKSLRDEALQYFYALERSKATQDPYIRRAKSLSVYLGKKMIELRKTKKQFIISEGGILESLIPLSTTNGPFAWSSFHNYLSPNAQSLFKFTLKTTLISNEEGPQVRELVNVRNNVGVRLEGIYSSLAGMINNEFRSELYNMCWKQKLSLDHAPFIRTSFLSFPEVLLFEIMRFVSEGPNSEKQTFYSGLFTFEKVLLVGSHTYRLTSRIEYDSTEQTYSAATFDFGNCLEYQYKYDGTVTNTHSVEDVVVDRNTVFAFYVKVTDEQGVSSLASTTHIDEQGVNTLAPATPIDEQGVSTLASATPIDEQGVSTSATTTTIIATSAQEQWISFSLKQPATIPADVLDEPNSVQQHQSHVKKRTFEDAPDWNMIYRPNVSQNHPDNFRNHFEKVEIFLKSKCADQPIEFLNFQAKLFYRTYPLGSESYSFSVGSDGRSYAALEIFLTNLASNMKIVVSLFDSFEAGQQTEIQQMFTLTILKMLLGCKEINLERIVEYFHLNQNVHLNTSEKGEYVDVDFKSKFFQILRVFNCKYLLSLPEMNLIKYSGLETDDPETITSNIFPAPIRPTSIITPRPAFIKGGWFDYRNGKEIYRRRCVCKSESEMFIIVVDRRFGINHKLFDINDLALNGSEYTCSGVVSLRRNSEDVLDLHTIDSFQSTQMFRSTSPGKCCEIYESNDSNVNYFNDLVKSRSVMLFYVKNGPRTFESKFKYTKYLKSKLMKAVITDYARDINLKKA